LSRGRRVVLAIGLVLPFVLVLAPAPTGLAQRYVEGKEPDRPRLQYADSLVSLNDRCIVKGTKLNPRIHPVYVNGQPIGFCCAPCPSVFVQDPENWLKDKDVDVKCLVSPARKSMRDEKHFARIGNDLFFFASTTNRKRFNKNPFKYLKRLTDPVTFERFEATVDSPSLVHDQVLYYFASEANLRTFQAAPDSFAQIRGAMF
jgi:YHS domain-containing protein